MPSGRFQRAQTARELVTIRPSGEEPPLDEPQSPAATDDDIEDLQIDEAPVLARRAPSPRPRATAASVEHEEAPPPASQRTTALAFVAGTVAVVGIAVFLVTRGSDRGSDSGGAGAATTTDAALVAMAPADAGAPAGARPDARPLARMPPDAAPVAAVPPDAAGLSAHAQWRETMDRARSAERKGEVELALELANQAMELRHTARGYLLRANILADNGRLDAALADLADAVRIAPQSAAAWKTKGLLHFQMHQNAEAKEALGRYLELRPNASDAGHVQKIIDQL